MKKENNKQVVRSELLEIAQKLFSKFGFDRTTMETIAKAAHKGKSTLYYYFKNKEEIFAAVIEKEGQIIQNELIKVINQNKPSKQLFKEYVLKRSKLFKSLVNYYNVFKEDYLNNIKIIEKYRKKHDQFELWALKQILIKGIMNKELKISFDSVDDIAFVIAVAIKGLEIPIFLENNFDIETKLDMLLDLLYCGIGSAQC